MAAGKTAGNKLLLTKVVGNPPLTPKRTAAPSMKPLPVMMSSVSLPLLTLFGCTAVKAKGTTAVVAVGVGVKVAVGVAVSVGVGVSVGPADSAEADQAGVISRNKLTSKTR